MSRRCRPFIVDGRALQTFVEVWRGGAVTERVWLEWFWAKAGAREAEQARGVILCIVIVHQQVFPIPFHLCGVPQRVWRARVSQTESSRSIFVVVVVPAVFMLVFFVQVCATAHAGSFGRSLEAGGEVGCEARVTVRLFRDAVQVRIRAASRRPMARRYGLRSARGEAGGWPGSVSGADDASMQRGEPNWCAGL